MVKLGLLIFNGCSFSLFKYILVSVEHALQYLITVCFGLKLLIMKHLKGGVHSDWAAPASGGSSENLPQSPWHCAGAFPSASPWCTLPSTHQSCCFMALSSTRNIMLDANCHLVMFCQASGPCWLQSTGQGLCPGPWEAAGQLVA